MKIALISSSERALWQSCRSISTNISKIYSEYLSSTNQIIYKTISPSSTALDIYEVANSLAIEGCDLIVWTEYNPLPNNFLRIFDRRIIEFNQKRPKLLFYLYGDFVLHLSKWGEIEELLKNYEVTMRCASSKHAKLVNKFFNGDKYKCDYKPFPVNPNTFYFDQELRSCGRKKYSFDEDETIFLYSGRLSFQKNIFHLINGFRDYLSISSKKAKLVLAGPFDDLGMPYLGLSGPLNAFYGQIKTLIASNQSLFDENKIIFLGDVEQENLNELYCASDALINLSTHNDEDYGMAPAEALCTGLPSILTSWGGFCDFKTLCPDNVKTISIAKERERFLPVYKDIVRQLLLFVPLNNMERMKACRIANEKLSIEAISKDTLRLVDTKFDGYSDTFKKIREVFKNASDAPFRGARGQLNEYYFELYSEYGELKNEE